MTRIRIACMLFWSVACCASELDELMAKAADFLPDLNQTTLQIGTITVAVSVGEPMVISGLHARRDDGTWVAGLVLPLAPKSVVTDGTQRISLADLDAAVAKIEPPEGPGFEQYIDSFPREERQSVRAIILNGLVIKFIAKLPVGGGAGGSLGNCSAALLQLYRLRAPGAEAALSTPAVLLANMPPDVDLDGAAPCLRSLFSPAPSHPDKKTEIHLRNPGRALATGLHRWFRLHLESSIPAPFTPLSPARAAAGARAVLSSTDGLRYAEVDGLEARAVALLISPENGSAADLLSRLQRWDGRDLHPEQNQQIPSVFTNADLVGLFGLVKDPRPSRWIDAHAPRTLGDLALRALAMVLGFDAQRLVDQQVETSWTAVEREVVVTALAAWRHQHADLDAKAIRAWVMPRLSVSEMYLLAEQHESERAELLAALLPTWRQGQPEPYHIDALVGLLSFTERGSELERAVASWSSDGSARLLVATLRGRDGDRALLTACRNEALQGAGMTWHQVFPVLSRLIIPDDLECLTRELVADVPSPGISSLAATVLLGGAHTAEANLLYPNDDDAMRRAWRASQALSHACYVTLLADRREAPRSVIAEVVLNIPRHSSVPGQPPASPPDPNRIFPAGTRWCDLAAGQAARLNQSFGLIPYDRKEPDLEQLAFTAFAPVAERDKAIARIRALSATSLPGHLALAGLTPTVAFLAPGLLAVGTVTPGAVTSAGK